MKKPVFGMYRALWLAAAVALLGACAQSPKTVQAPSYISILRQNVDFSVQDVAYSPRQKAVFVSAAAVLGAEEDTVSGHVLRMDPATLQIQDKTPLGDRAYGLVLDDDAARLYVGTDAGKVRVLDAKTGNLLHTVALDKAEGLRPLSALALDAKNQRLWVVGPKLKDSALYVINTRDMRVEKTFTGLGFIASAIALDDDKKRAWVANMQGQLHIVNTATLAVEKVLDIALDEPTSLAFDAQRQRLWAADGGAEYAKLRASEGGLADYTPRSPRPPGISRPDIRPGYRVVAFEPDTGALLSWVELNGAAQPQALLLDARRGYLYAAHRQSTGMLAAIDIGNTAERQMPVHSALIPTRPHALALDPVSGAVFVAIQNAQNAHMRPQSRIAETVARVLVPDLPNPEKK